jgi:hypothetical protein
VRSRGISVRDRKDPGVSVYNLISNSKTLLLILIKSLENHRQIKKDANTIFLDSWGRALQRFLNLSRLFLIIFA